MRLWSRPYIGIEPKEKHNYKDVSRIEMMDRALSEDCMDIFWFVLDRG
jgi:hypothetical protein